MGGADSPSRTIQPGHGHAGRVRIQGELMAPCPDQAISVHPVILAGGSGTRLWPLSREYFPKPFLNLAGNRSLFQETILRLDGIERVSRPTVVCNEEHRFLVVEQTGEIESPPLSIILEPASRNTAPALTLAALALTGSGAERPDPVMVVLPADHVIKDMPPFRSAVRAGIELAARGSLVTFGIVPRSPKTGYGYVEKGPALDPAAVGSGPFRVSRFIEKPDAPQAESMVRSGRFLWNSGMFVMRASLWLREIEARRPDIFAACRAAHHAGRRDGTFLQPDRNSFEACPADSIDYAVLEKAAGGDAAPESADCVVIQLDAGWSDVGAWSALWEDGARDADGNVKVGDVHAESTANSLLIGTHRLLATVGLEDVIAVETPDAVLVAGRDRVQDVKNIVAALRANGRPEQENPRRVHRPWGSYETVDSGPGFQVKRLTVNPGASLSLQIHHSRSEHWVVVEGTARVTRGHEQLTLGATESIDIPVGVRHRLENPGDVPVKVIEVQSGEYLGEDDIVRVEDRYDRGTPEQPR